VSRPPSRWSCWQILGFALAGVLAVCGLAVLALGMLFAAGMSAWGSNK
jgi:hypothetical protein